MMTRVGKPFVEDETDFNVPISKYFKLIRRSYNDFDVVQITKVTQLPPIQKFSFEKKSPSRDPVIETNVPSADRSSHDESKSVTEKPAAVSINLVEEKRSKWAEPRDAIGDRMQDTGETDKRVRTPARVNRNVMGKRVPSKVPAKLPETKEPGLNINEEPKKTGCYCLLL